jgi:hypothetical protein
MTPETAQTIASSMLSDLEETLRDHPEGWTPKLIIRLFNLGLAGAAIEQNLPPAVRNVAYRDENY